MDQWVDAAEDDGCAVMRVKGKSVLSDDIQLYTRVLVHRVHARCT